MMTKKLILIFSLLLLPTPVMSQQVNTFGVCTQYREVYIPGGYDSYGNYYPGNVETQVYNVPCRNHNRYSYRNRYRNCSPSRTLFGAVLGGTIGNVVASPSSKGWATALGASIGGLSFAC